MKIEGHFSQLSQVPQCFREVKTIVPLVNRTSLTHYIIYKELKELYEFTRSRKQHKQEVHNQTYPPPDTNNYCFHTK